MDERLRFVTRLPFQSVRRCWGEVIRSQSWCWAGGVEALAPAAVTTRLCQGKRLAGRASLPLWIVNGRSAQLGRASLRSVSATLNESWRVSAQTQARDMQAANNPSARADWTSPTQRVNCLLRQRAARHVCMRPGTDVS